MSDRALVAEANLQYQEAASVLDEALALDQYNPELWLQRGVVLAKAGAYEGAERSFLKAVEYAPDSPDPWLNLTLLYDLVGDPAGAAAARQEAEARAE